MNKTMIFAGVVLMILLASGCTNGKAPRACTADAKLCPDGSAVGRTGPNCEFAPCPSEEKTKTACGGWTTLGDTVCECSGEYEKPLCPADAVCDSQIYFCHGTCGECKCYQGPESRGIEISCPGESTDTTAPASSGMPERCCSDLETGKEMCWSEVVRTAEDSECLEQGNFSESGNIDCNEGTGTWWIDLDIQKEGCSPACVVNVNTKQAEINWRCTGLIMQ